MAQEAEKLLKQKIQLGLIKQDRDRLKALDTLKVSSSKEDMRFAIILVDYNPYSGLLKTSELIGLDFYKRIDIFYAGFGLWKRNAQPLEPS